MSIWEMGESGQRKLRDSVERIRGTESQKMVPVVGLRPKLAEIATTSTTTLYELPEDPSFPTADLALKTRRIADLEVELYTFNDNEPVTILTRELHSGKTVSLRVAAEHTDEVFMHPNAPTCPILNRFVSVGGLPPRQITMDGRFTPE